MYNYRQAYVCHSTTIKHTVSKMQLNKLIKDNKHFLKIRLGFFRRYLLNDNFKRNSLYNHYFNKLKVKKNVILYESSNAKRINGNPYALFRYLVDNPTYSNFTHVWSTNDLNSSIVKKYSSYKNVKFVLYNSKEYLKYLTSAKYLINDSTFPYYFIKKEDQIYVNIWHGTPLKYMGKDIKSTTSDHKNVQRNFLHTSYLINSNKYTADVLLRSHDVYTLYQGYIANIGYPSVDFVFNTDKRKLRELLGINDDETIVLYAPTWRGKSPNSVNDTVNEIFDHINKIKGNLPPKFRLFLKLHTYTMSFASPELKKIAIPDHLEINEMLSITDILITDYSSVFFEFLGTKKPVLFFCYDKNEYIKERGLYIPLEELPGPICETSEEVIDSLRNIKSIQKKYVNTYSNFTKKFAPNDDGNASKRVADLIFNNASFPENEVYKIKDERKKLLLYPSSLLNNEVTKDFINLVTNLDYQNYDIYVFLDQFSHEDIKTNILKLSKDVKILYKVGGFGFSLHNYFWHNRLMEEGIFNETVEKNIPRELYVNEAKRLFGTSNFDSVLDFRGSQKTSVILFAFGNFKRKYIYSHYLCNDYTNIFYSNKQKVAKNIKIIFSVYKYYDKVFTSIDPDLIDKTIFNEFPDLKNAFKPLKCPIDYKNILELAKDNIKTFDNINYHCEEYEMSDKKIKISGIALPNESYVNFVFLGKLIYKGGVSKLINAFNRVHSKYPNIRLYIIGNGSLEFYLKNQVLKRGLNNKIIIINSLSNPFWILNRCDCIISLFNTDKNISLMQALVLDKPLITIDNPNSKEIIDSYGIMVQNSEKSIAKGMIQFIENGYEQKHFDFVKYNEKTLSNFYNEVFDL